MDNSILNLKTLTCLVVALSVMTGSVFADAVVVRQQTRVSQDKILLCDVAVLDGKAAKALGDIVVAELRSDLSSTEISIDSVREALTGHGINWGRISLRGFDVCRVQRQVEQKAAVVSQEDAPVVSNSVRTMDVAGPTTVREKIVSILIDRTGYDINHLHIQFNERNARLLDQSLLVGRWVVEPTVSGKLGRVPFAIRHYQNDVNMTNYRLIVDVARKVTAVVTTRHISQNQTLTPGDVEVREVLTTHPRIEPIADTSLVIGKVSSARLKAGSIVSADRLRSRWLIRRGDMVTVRCISGLLEIKTTARAQEDGSRDQLIQVKNPNTREIFLAKVIGRGEVVMEVNNSNYRASGDQS